MKFLQLFSVTFYIVIVVYSGATKLHHQKTSLDFLRWGWDSIGWVKLSANELQD